MGSVFPCCTEFFSYVIVESSTTAISLLADRYDKEVATDVLNNLGFNMIYGYKAIN